MHETSLADWYIAYVVTAVVIVVVVALVGIMLETTRRIGRHSLDLAAEMDRIRLRTRSLRETRSMAGQLDRIAGNGGPRDESV